MWCAAEGAVAGGSCRQNHSFELPGRNWPRARHGAPSIRGALDNNLNRQVARKLLPAQPQRNPGIRHPLFKRSRDPTASINLRPRGGRVPNSTGPGTPRALVLQKSRWEALVDKGIALEKLDAAHGESRRVLRSWTIRRAESPPGPPCRPRWKKGLEIPIRER